MSINVYVHTTHKNRRRGKTKARTYCLTTFEVCVGVFGCVCARVHRRAVVPHSHTKPTCVLERNANVATERDTHTQTQYTCMFSKTPGGNKAVTLCVHHIICAYLLLSLPPSALKSEG
jgi:hypothetical protein